MAQQILSILLSADGLSFWTGDLAENFDTDRMVIRKGYDIASAHYPLNVEGVSNEEAINDAFSEFKGILAARELSVPESTILYADTLSTVLVPDSVFDEKDTGEYLRLHGIPVKEGEYAVCSKNIHGTVAVVVLDRNYTECLGKALGTFAVSSPLQYNLCLTGEQGNPEDFIRVYTTGLNCYITAFREGKPVYSDSHPLASAADLIYYLDWLAGRFGSKSWPVIVDGYGAEELARLACRHFKGCICA